MNRWVGPLGSHAAGAPRPDLTILVIKGDLLRRYPSTLITAERGTTTRELGDTPFVSENPPQLAHEVFRGFLGADVTFVGLNIKLARLREHPDEANRLHCWYISLLEPHDEPRFGLDDSQAEPGSNRDTVDPDGSSHFDRADQWSWQGLRRGKCSCAGSGRPGPSLWPKRPGPAARTHRTGSTSRRRLASFPTAGSSPAMSVTSRPSRSSCRGPAVTCRSARPGRPAPSPSIQPIPIWSGPRTGCGG